MNYHLPLTHPKPSSSRQFDQQILDVPIDHNLIQLDAKFVYLNRIYLNKIIFFQIVLIELVKLFMMELIHQWLRSFLLFNKQDLTITISTTRTVNELLLVPDTNQLSAINTRK